MSLIVETSSNGFPSSSVELHNAVLRYSVISSFEIPSVISLLKLYNSIFSFLCSIRLFTSPFFVKPIAEYLIAVGFLISFIS